MQFHIYRNRVRTPEERKHSVVKKIEAKRKEQGILKHKEIVAQKNRRIAKEKKLQKPKIGEFQCDLWEGNYYFMMSLIALIIFLFLISFS